MATETVFSESESAILRKAFSDGSLTTEQKRAIVARSEAAQQGSGKPRGLEDLTGGIVTRERSEALGGTLGAVGGALGGGALTLPSGPGAAAGAVAGMAGGGALGAAGGSLAFDNVENALRHFGVLEPTEKGPFEGALRAADAAVEDLQFGLGGELVGRTAIALKPALGKMLGLRTKEVGDLLQRASNIGLVTREGTETGAALGAANVGAGARGAVLRGANTVMGIFPWIGGPGRRAAAAQGEAINKVVNRTLNALAPNATLSNRMSLDMVNAAKGVQKEFVDEAAIRYNKFRSFAANLSRKDVVPAENIRAAAERFVAELDAQKITLRSGDELPRAIDEDLNTFLTKMADLPDRLSINQVQGLADDLKSFVDTARASGFDIKKVATVKEAMEDATRSLRTDLLKEGEGERLLALLNDADSFYADGIVRFQTATGKKFGRADKNIFRAGFEEAGALEPDQLVKMFNNVDSSMQVKHLSKLVGPDNIGALARRHVEDAWEASKVFDASSGDLKGINWDQFSKEVGFSGVKKNRSEAVEAMMSIGGVDAKVLREIIDIAGKIDVPRDVSTFIARRAALGGAAGAVGGATAMTIVKDSLLKSAAVAFGFTYMNKIINSPKQLRLLRAAVDRRTGAEATRQMLGRMIEFVSDSEELERVPGALF